MVYNHGIQQSEDNVMTTARERYGAKTRVVTFRVTRDLYDEIQKLKADSGLSFADLIKLGAGKTEAKIEAKADEASELKDKLAELNEAIEAAQRKLSEIGQKERQVQLARLAKETEMFRLFDLGWTVREVSLKLSISDKESYGRFKEWGQIRKQRRVVQGELVRRCLQKHIGWLQEQILWRATGKDLAEAKEQMDYCQNLFPHPSNIDEGERAFLIGKYSYLV